MPQNQIIRWGIIVVVAVVLLWLGYFFLDFVKPILPWAGGVGIAMIVGGALFEAKKNKDNPVKTDNE